MISLVGNELELMEQLMELWTSHMGSRKEKKYTSLEA